MLNYFEAYKY